MFILRWKCLYNDLGGQLPPAPKWLAEAIRARLQAQHPDYRYWIEQVCGANGMNGGAAV